MAAEHTIAALAERMRAELPVVHRGRLALDGLSVELESNQPAIVEQLQAYFAPFQAPHADPKRVVVSAFECAQPDFGLAFRPWPREPGKAQDKEQYADLADGRIVRKVRTGMQFLVSDDGLLAVGPCLANVNQLINVINFELISTRLDAGWALCHSAAVARGEHGLAISGISGAGKSTLALWLLSEDFDYVSNDRVLVRADTAVRLCGVPKHPRCNPGTLLANPVLRPILSEARRAELSALPQARLWALEDKYDVDVARVYGPGRIRGSARLQCFVVLTWAFGRDAPTSVRETTFARDPALLDAVMKPAGPFYHNRGAAAEVGRERYIDELHSVPVLELGGGVDFARAIAVCRASCAGP